MAAPSPIGHGHGLRVMQSQGKGRGKGQPAGIGCVNHGSGKASLARLSRASPGQQRSPAGWVQRQQQRRSGKGVRDERISGLVRGDSRGAGRQLSAHKNPLLRPRSKSSQLSCLSLFCSWQSQHSFPAALPIFLQKPSCCCSSFLCISSQQLGAVEQLPSSSFATTLFACKLNNGHSAGAVPSDQKRPNGVAALPAPVLPLPRTPCLGCV